MRFSADKVVAMYLLVGEVDFVMTWAGFALPCSDADASSGIWRTDVMCFIYAI